MDNWSIEGELILNCNCTVFCPCVISLGKHPPTEGYCQAWAGVRIDRGSSGGVDVSGLNIALLLDIPGKMERGNWTLALWIDDRATDEQFERLETIFRGGARGTTGLFKLLVGQYLGAERSPITFETDGDTRRLAVGRHIQGAVTPIAGARSGEDVVVVNTEYWMGPEVVVAQAVEGRVRAFGRVWNFEGRSGDLQHPVVGSVSAPAIAVSRRLRSTPWTTRIEAAGVQAYTVYNHMLLPTGFRGVEADYEHLRSAVQVWDVACERQVEIVGPDAARLAQMLTVRDLGTLGVGRCAYAPVCDHDGMLLNDPVVLRVADDRFWFSVADSDIVLWAGGLALGHGLDVRVHEPDVSPLAVQGPFAEDVVAAVFGDDACAIRFFRFEQLAFRGHLMVVARTGWSAQGGFEIYVDDAQLGGELYDALMEAGRDHDIGPGCPNLIERIEAGLLTYGTDITRNDTPLEAGLERYCALDAPIDAIGIDALRRQAEAGVTRRIAGFTIDGDPVPLPRDPFPVLVNGTRSGQVTSAVWSPRLATNVALGTLAVEHTAPGTVVDVELPEGRRTATVSAVPFPGASQR